MCGTNFKKIIFQAVTKMNNAVQRLNRRWRYRKCNRRFESMADYDEHAQSIHAKYGRAAARNIHGCRKLQIFSYLPHNKRHDNIRYFRLRGIVIMFVVIASGICETRRPRKSNSANIYIRHIAR